ncbi:MAG: SRPBCC family protein [Gemmatimonadaceae bacterium]
MRQFSREIDIAAPPQRVWEVMCEVERWSEWTSSITSIEKLDSGPLCIGARYRIRQPRLPATEWTVTEIDPRKSFVWTARRPGVVTTGRHSVAAADQGSRVTLTLHYGGRLGGLIGRKFGKLTDRYLALEAVGLKVRIEGQGATALDPKRLTFVPGPYVDVVFVATGQRWPWLEPLLRRLGYLMAWRIRRREFRAGDDDPR